MTLVASFTFNPFQENTYVLYDDTKECAIFDPGCYTEVEKTQLTDFIEEKGLKPVKLINTHCHLDHIAALPLYVARRRLMKMAPPRIYLPAFAKKRPIQ